MIIIKESDFYIVKEEKQFVLYLIKSKKELSEDSEDKFKIGGYYTNIENAFRSVYTFRKSKKYPGKESFKDTAVLMRNFVKINKNFNKIINSIYSTIFMYKYQILNKNE